VSAERGVYPSLASREYGFGAKLWNFTVVLLIFMLVGPPVGIVTFSALLAIWFAQEADAAGAASVIGVLTIYGLIFSWFLGGLPAALIGLTVAAWQTFVGRMGWALAGLIGLGAGVAMTLWAGDAFSGYALAEPAMLPVGLLTCFAPTMVCWLLARSFVTAGPGA
jgi:hypothetical protein